MGVSVISSDEVDGFKVIARNVNVRFYWYSFITVQWITKVMTLAFMHSLWKQWP